jgi:Arc/MetJ-type ribon-helix-helix transcriptional regulator
MRREIKEIMVSARLPPSMVNRVDYVVRNAEDCRNRSEAVYEALELWLVQEEMKLEARGILQKKAR